MIHNSKIILAVLIGSYILAEFPAYSQNLTEKKPASSSTENPQAGLPSDASEFLNSLPGKSISLDLVVGRSIQSSDSFKIVKALQPSIDSAQLEARSSNDVLFEMSFNRVIDKNESPTFVAPLNLRSSSASLGLSTYLPSGTALSATLGHNQTAYDLGAFPSVDYLESTATVAISQSLLKDSFGTATRSRIKAGAFSSEASKLDFDRTIETWSLDLIQFFYQAWVLQTNTKAAKLGVARRERLLNITRIRYKRGTAEQPDLLQVENALTNSRALYSDTKQSLTEIWGELVMGLKLPKHWIDINPENIPMVIDEPVSEALSLCGPGQNSNKMPSSSIDVAYAKKNAEASASLLSASKNSLLPDLKLVLGLSSNGVDSRFGRTRSEVYKSQNPEWTLGLAFSVPFSHFAEEASLRRAFTQDMRAQAFADKAQSDFEVSWVNSCTDLRRLQVLTLEYEEASKKQALRVELEEKRFNIGRSTPFNVIQAGDEATAAEVNLYNTQAKTRVAAWKVKRLAGKMPAYLEGLAKITETLTARLQ